MHNNNYVVTHLVIVVNNYVICGGLFSNKLRNSVIG